MVWSWLKTGNKLTYKLDGFPRKQWQRNYFLTTKITDFELKSNKVRGRKVSLNFVFKFKFENIENTIEKFQKLFLPNK